MENASKALVIAGAILLVIAIIAIAVGIVSSTRGTINVAENQITAMEVKMHNEQFKMYEGEVTGAEVQDCISKVLSNNNETTNLAMKMMVTVKSSTSTYTYNYGINQNNPSGSPLRDTFVSSTIDIKARFDCTTTINSQGIIYKLVFTEK